MLLLGDLAPEPGTVTGGVLASSVPNHSSLPVVTRRISQNIRILKTTFSQVSMLRTLHIKLQTDWQHRRNSYADLVHLQ